MKQRILAILLSLTMMFTLVPTAMAEGDEAPAGGEPTPVETHAVKTTKTGDVTYSADDAKIENLVYTSGTMTVTGANVTIENVTFGCASCEYHRRFHADQLPIRTEYRVW